MIKKLVICLLSIIISITFIELILQVVPTIYSCFPISKNTAYIYILGESTAWGQPYHAKINYSKIIYVLCDGKIDNKQIKLINLSKVGDTIFGQYKKYYIYKFLHPFQKGIALVYMGSNISSIEKYDNISTLKQFVFNVTTFVDILGPNNFKQKYEKFLKLGKKFGDEFYISTIPCNFSAFFPEYYKPLIQEKNKFEEIDRLIISNKLNEAKEKLKNIPTYENNSQINFRLAKIYERENNIKEANNEYLNALEYDNYDYPTITNRYQNNVIKELSIRYNIPYFDFFSYLMSLNQVIGFNFFIDNGHPLPYLQIKLAQEYVSMLEKKHSILNRNITQENIFEQLNFSNEDLFQSYLDALGEIFFCSYFSYSCDREIKQTKRIMINEKKLYLNVYNLDIIKDYINKLYEINSLIEKDNKNSREEMIHLCEILLEYIQGNTENIIELINKYNLKDTILKREDKNENRMQCWWYMKHWLIDFIVKNKI